MTAEPGEPEAGACGGCGAPYEYRDGIRRSSCSTSCPALFEGIAVRLQVGDNPAALIGSIIPDTHPDATQQQQDAMIRTELARLMHAMADHLAALPAGPPTGTSWAGRGFGPGESPEPR